MLPFLNLPLCRWRPLAMFMLPLGPPSYTVVRTNRPNIEIEIIKAQQDQLQHYTGLPLCTVVKIDRSVLG